MIGLKKAEVIVRSDHLEAAISYCLEQTDSGAGQINPLAWGDNENAVGELLADDSNLDQAYNDIKNALEIMLLAVKAARGHSHGDLILIPLPQHYVPVEAHSYESN